MTSLLDAESNLITEVKNRIIDIVPERESAKRFVYRDKLDRELSSIEQAFISPREFEIGDGQFIKNIYYGSGTRGLTYRYPISFQYPTEGGHWTSAANSDMELIRHDLISNATSVAGVQGRWIDQEMPFDITRNPDDPWFVSVFYLIVYYDIS